MVIGQFAAVSIPHSTCRTVDCLTLLETAPTETGNGKSLSVFIGGALAPNQHSTFGTRYGFVRISDPVQRLRHQSTVTNLDLANHSPTCTGRSADLQGRAVVWP